MPDSALTPFSGLPRASQGIPEMKMNRFSNLPLFTALLLTAGLTVHCAGTSETAQSEEQSATSAEALKKPCDNTPHVPARTVYGVDTNNVLVRFQATWKRLVLSLAFKGRPSSASTSGRPMAFFTVSYTSQIAISLPI